MLICIIPKRSGNTDLTNYSSVYCNSGVLCFLKRQNYLLPHLTKSSPAQLWLNKLLLFFVIYFYLKEFVSLSQKLDKHTTNSSKVRRVTLMVESSLGIPNVPKVKRRKNRERKKYSKQIQNPWWLWGETLQDLSSLIVGCRCISAGSSTI